MKYSVLIVDDSAVMRKKLSEIIDAKENFYSVAKARNGMDALEKIAYFDPQIVLLDVDMPVLNGWEMLRLQRNKSAVHIILLGECEEDREKARMLGASDFVTKESFLTGHTQCVERLVQQRSVQTMQQCKTVMKDVQPVIVHEKRQQLVVIGSSTGGPAALQCILTALPSHFTVPIVIVQHMPEGFTKPLAYRFNELCAFPVKEAEHNEILQQGTVYIAPAGTQTIIKQLLDGQYKITLQQTATYNTLYKPSVDVTLQSIAPQAKHQLLTVILTGMGDDGLQGCSDVKAYGGTVFVEAEETCVVYGMPKVVMNAGIADQQLLIQDMAPAIEQYMQS